MTHCVFPRSLYQDLDGSGRIRYTEFLAATIEAQGAISEERLAEASLGRQPLYPPASVLGRVQETVVQAVPAALPELDLVRPDAVSAPEGR